MPYFLSYYDDARLDVRDAKAWYKKQQPGLERRFSDSIKTAINKLEENPFAYAIRYKNIRIAHPKTFPYGIHFFIDESNHQMVIIAIIHNKRHPKTTQKRL